MFIATSCFLHSFNYNQQIFSGNDFGYFEAERAAPFDLQEIISEDCERCTVKCGGVKQRRYI